MSRLSRLALMLGLLAVPCLAETVLFQGILAADNDVVLNTFTIAATDLVTIYSYGYAGARCPQQPQTHLFPRGGFAPGIFLFDSTGTIEYGSSNDGIVDGACQTAYDSVTGNCDDPYFQDTLSAGSYTVALAVYDNSLNGPYLSDGFAQDGNPGFTCEESGTDGTFCDVTYAGGPSRDGDFTRLRWRLIPSTIRRNRRQPAYSVLECAFFAALLLRRRKLIV